MTETFFAQPLNDQLLKPPIYGVIPDGLRFKHGPEAELRVPRIVRKYDTALNDYYLTVELSEQEKHTDKIGFNERTLETIVSYGLPLRFFSELEIFEASNIFESTILEAKHLYEKRPEKNDSQGRESFRKQYQRARQRLSLEAMDIAFWEFKGENDARVYIDDPEIIVRNKARLSRDKSARELLKNYLKHSTINLGEKQIQQILHSYYVTLDMSETVLDLSLGDIGFMKHKFSEIPLTFYATMTYLDNFAEYSPNLTDDIMTRIIWSLEQNEHVPPGEFSPYYLARAISIYSQLLTSLADLCYHRATAHLDTIGRKDWRKVNESRDKSYSFMKRSFKSALASMAINRPVFSPNTTFTYLRASKNGLGDGYSSRVIESLKDTHLGEWLWKTVFEYQEKRHLERQSAYELPFDQSTLREYEIGTDPRLRPFVLEESYKSFLRILLMSDRPLKQQLRDYGIATDNLYDCEISGKLLKTILEHDVQRVFDIDKALATPGLLKFSIFATNEQIGQVFSALYQDRLPSIKVVKGSCTELTADITEYENGRFVRMRPVYLSTDSDGKRVSVPVDRDSQHRIENPAEYMESFFKQGNFAGLFIHFKALVSEQRITDSATHKQENIPISAPIEIRILPLSQHQYYHDQQHLNWVRTR